MSASASAKLEGDPGSAQVRSWYDANLAAAGWQASSGPSDLVSAGPDLILLLRGYRRGLREMLVLDYQNFIKGDPGPLPDGHWVGWVTYTVYPEPCDGSSFCGYVAPPSFGA